MNPALDGSVELLGRSLAYTRTALDGVDDSPAGLARPTPCALWDLGRLLVHMEDSLDAFTEAAEGLVEVRQTPHPPPYDGPPAPGRVDVIRLKACAMLTAWVSAPAERVDVGDAVLAAPVLMATAALEITIHGWDVATATGVDHPVPTDLAVGLLGLAEGLVRPADRLGRFGPALETPGRAAPDELLLAHLGRVPTPRSGHPGSFRFWEGRGVRAAF